MAFHRRDVLALLAPGLTALAAAGDEPRQPVGPAAGDFPDEDLAGAVLSIDLAAVQENWRLLQQRAGRAECAAAVKADAYGLGMVPVCRALWAAGCRSFFVARPREGERLRTILDEATIYVLDGLFAGEPGHFERFALRPALISIDEARSWAAWCRSRGRRLPCAVHVDTGINRLGFTPQAVTDLVADTATRDDLAVALVMSHLACADEPAHPMNAAQRDAFRVIRGRLPGVPASLAASSGIFLGADYTLDMVRPGLAVYGGNPTPAAANPMRPVMRLDGVVLQVREVDRGGTVGYGATWQALRPSRIALVGAGYTDGIPRGFSSSPDEPSAEVAIGGVRCPVVGRVSMDMLAVDVTLLEPDSVVQGTRAEIIGPSIPIDEAAGWAETIGYELFARLGSRFARRYTGFAPAD